MAHNSREDVVYGASERGPVFAIDCSSNQVIASFNALGPNDIAYCSTENKAYCTAADTLLVIDGTSHARLKAMYLEWATDCIWDPVNNCVYVSCGDNNEVAVVDCTTDLVTNRIRVGRWPVRMHLNTRHHKLYVLNSDGESISIVDLATNEVVKTIRLDNVPEAGCYSAAVDKYYCSAGSEVVVVDGAGDSVLSVIDLPLHMTVRSAVAVESESLVIVGTSCPTAVDTVYVVSATSDTVAGTLVAGEAPCALHWSDRSRVVYCANGASENVSVIAGDGSGVLRTLPVGEAPFAFACAPRHRRLYVGHLNGDHVYVIRDSVTGIAEPERLEAVSAPRRSVLAGCSYLLPGAEGLSLVDACGRGVGVLEPGPNDLALLAPGVHLGLAPSGEVRLRLVKLR